MNSKKAITLLVLATLVMSLVPIIPVSAINYGNTETTAGANSDAGVYDDTRSVIGGGITSGYTVELYWDSVQAWDGEAGLLNTTTAKAAGTYDIWFDVPDSVQGDHYLWVRDATTGDTAVSVAFVVGQSIDASSTSGLPDDEVDAEVYGFEDEDVVAILLGDANLPVGTAVAAESVDPSTGGVNVLTNYEHTLANLPVTPGSVVIDVDGGATYNDAPGLGVIVGVGTVNYITGEIEFDHNDGGADQALTVDYQHYGADVADTVYLFESELEVGELGSDVVEITIPADADMAANVAPYKLLAYNGDGDVAEVDFTIGPVITLSADEGPTGSKITVEGRGFDSAQDIDDYEIVIVDDGQAFGHASAVACKIKGTAVDISDTEFSCDIFIPTVDDTGDYEIVVLEAGGGDEASAGFEVLGLPGVTIETSHGVSGETLTISGYNYTAEEGVDVEFAVFADGYAIALDGVGADADDYEIELDAELVANFAQSIETEADGTFTGTVTLPAVADNNYDIVAYQDGYNVYGDDDFRVSLMVVVLSKQAAESGKSVTMTGSGFEGFANATISGETLFGISGNAGTFSEVVYIPTLDVGMHVITVTDETNEISVEIDFEVLEASYLVIDPVEAPVSSGGNNYNMSLEGYYFSTKAGDEDLTFTLFNMSADGSADETWNLDVNHMWDDDANAATPNVERDAELNGNGNFTGYFDILAAADMGLGKYYINVTDNADLCMAQISFDLVTETEVIGNKDDVYSIGDVVAFDISNSFAQDDSFIEIEDPSGDLYWSTNTFDDNLGDWIASGDLVKVPYYLQTSNGQLMELAADAPLGEWSWVWYEGGADGDEIASGTFMVEAATESLVGEQVEDLNNEIMDLAEQLTDVTGEFADVKSDIADVAAVAEQAVAAAQAAAEAVNAVAATASTASDAAADAAEAANAARDAASGLTTLVYGAIGAALVAALAAIVSLMQISRRIAG